MKDPQTTIMLLTSILVLALWKSGRMEKVINVVFGGKK